MDFSSIEDLIKMLVEAGGEPVATVVSPHGYQLLSAGFREKFDIPMNEKLEYINTKWGPIKIVTSRDCPRDEVHVISKDQLVRLINADKVVG